MVGYEPDLDLFKDKDFEKRLRRFLSGDRGSDDEPSNSNTPLSGVIGPCNTLLADDNASLSVIRPCNSNTPVLADDNASLSVIRPCNSNTPVLADDNASLSSRLTRPYHLRKLSLNDNDDRLTTPLIQVFSVCIDVGKPCEIYGTIRAWEESRPRFYLYERGPEDSETIVGDGTLSLIGPHGGAIIPSLNNSLDFCLRDRVQGVDVVNSELDLDPVTEDSYDRLLKRDVPGPLAVAHVYYAVFQYAHYATVQVTVTKNDVGDNSCHATDIYGSIVAGYANARKYCSVDEDLKLLETRVFDKQSHQPLRVMLGTPISLSRDVVVVPAYSTLTMQVNLWDSIHGKIADETLNFPAHMRGQDPVHIRTQYACVEVLVQWDHVYRYLYNDRFMEVSLMRKKPRVIYNQRPPSSFFPRMKPPVYVGFPKVEVFSVFVGGISKNISALCGAILVNDGGSTYSIYNRDDSCLELLSDNGLASIEVNYRAIDNFDFGIILFLRDPVGNLEVSRGSLGWHVGSLKSYMSWYNKRLCSVVRGDDGYAAVHYEVFNNAFEAFLEVKLLAEGCHDSRVNLHGSLFGLYGGYDYTTSYDNKYYKSRLFDRPCDRSVEQNVDSGIALLKSIVVVPNESYLIIEANLCLLGSDNVEVPIRGTHEFQIDLSNTVSKFIQGEHYRIEICVKFKMRQSDRIC
ncbi:hypothetical protein RND81_02G089200 [Saponaria officinalis]|uniref:DUF6598 domain-containing protein n=2 Tax=Saponaria officinalis TaxID=3572 RepID=A0AAW1MU21_SAPOF